MPRIFGGQDAKRAFKSGKPDLAKENTVCYLQILGLGTDCNDAAPSVLLFFDRQRYLFNAGEGFQRYCVEHKVKMNRISSCLLTRLTGDACGGLPGMCLTMADAGVQGPSQKPQLDIIGPAGLEAIASATRTFLSMSAVGVNAVEFGQWETGSKVQLQSQFMAPPFASPNFLPHLMTTRLPPPPFLQVNPTNPQAEYQTQALSLHASVKSQNTAELSLNAPGPLLGISTIMPQSKQAADQLQSPLGRRMTLPLQSKSQTATDNSHLLAAPRKPEVAQTTVQKALQDEHAESKLPVLNSTEQKAEGSQQVLRASTKTPDQVDIEDTKTGGKSSKASDMFKAGALASLSLPYSTQTPDQSQSQQHDQSKSTEAPSQEVALLFKTARDFLQPQDLPSFASDNTTSAVGIDQGTRQNEAADSLDAKDPELKSATEMAQNPAEAFDASMYMDFSPSVVGAGAGLKQPKENETKADGTLDPVIENDLITITPIIVTTKPENESTQRPAKKAKVEDPGNEDKQNSPPVTSNPSVPFTVNGPIDFDPPEKTPAACYVCELARVPGRFLPDKATELGVPRGEAFAILKSWKTYTLEDGTIIHPEQVNEPHHPGPVAIIADCPGLDYFHSLQSSKTWERFYAANKGEALAGGDSKEADVICHLAPAEVVESDGYQAWCDRFGGSTRHIFVNARATNGAPIMTSSAVIQARLNCVHGKIFPMHQYSESASAGPDAALNGERSSKTPVLLTSDTVEKEAVKLPERYHQRRQKHQQDATTDSIAEGESNGNIAETPMTGSDAKSHSSMAPQPESGLARNPLDNVAQTEAQDHPPNLGEIHTEKGRETREPATLTQPSTEDTVMTEVCVTNDRLPVDTASMTVPTTEKGLPPVSEQGVELGVELGQKRSFEEANDESYISPQRPRHGRIQVQACKVNENLIAGQNLLKFHLRPPSRRGCFDLGEVPAPTDFAQIQQEVRGNEDTMTTIEEALENGTGVNTGRGHSGVIQKIGPESLEITFLGTGAAIPSKYRNVTGIFMNFFRRGTMMMDCGEGSYGQLRRKFGGPQADEMVKALKLIWISHIHADHHAGLTSILNRRRRMLGHNCPKVLVYGPKALHRVLIATSQIQTLSCHFIDNGTSIVGHPGPKEEHNKQKIKDTLAVLGLTKLMSFTVDHCANAFGLQLESEDGWKLVFSGDTRPCMNVMQAAKNATVLIHEATFEDALEDEAVNKRHSTTCEAVEVGRKARAYRTILTHFSQRYPKIPVVDPSFRSTTCIAFDLMTVNLADLPVLPWLVHPLTQLFHGTYTSYEDDEDGQKENGKQLQQIGGKVNDEKNEAPEQTMAPDKDAALIMK